MSFVFVYAGQELRISLVNLNVFECVVRLAIFVFMYAGRHPLVSLNEFECVVRLAEI